MKIRLAPLFLAAATTFALSAMPARAELAKPFLWELSKGDKTVTLFGSLHVGKPDFYPIPELVQKRFHHAKVLAVEADVTVPETQQACSKMAATSEKLETILSADDYAALLGYVRAAGIPDTAIEGRKLWLVNLVLVGIELGQLGVDFSSGLDVAFLRDAKRVKKQVVEVEGGQKQCAALAAATTAETTAAMTRFLASVRQNRMERRLAEMVDAYRTGNGPSLIRVVNEEFGDSAEGIAARRRVFDDRHPAMAEAIDGYFKQADRHFVVIGVGHMFGDNSLLDALAKRGIRAKRIE